MLRNGIYNHPHSEEEHGGAKTEMSSLLKGLERYNGYLISLRVRFLDLYMLDNGFSFV